MKKILSLLITIFFIFSICGINVSADGNPVFALSSETASIGEEVALTFSVSDNPGIAIMKFTVTFNHEALEPLSVEQLDIFEESGLVSNLDEPGIDFSDYDNITILLANASNCYDNGDILLIKFRVKEKADKNVAVKIEYANGDILNENHERIELETVDGAVNVPDAENKTDEPEGGGQGGNSGTNKPSGGGSHSGSGGGGTGGAIIQQGQQDNNTSEQTDGSKTDADSNTPDKTVVSFNDIENHWAKDYINPMAGKGIFKGYEDGTFRPDIGLSRQEMAVSVVRLLGLEEELGTADIAPFTDDDKIASWAKDYVYLLVSKGIFKGYDDGSFGPDGVITREQLSLVLARALNNTPETLSEISFNDADKISGWAKDAVGVMVTLKIVNGYEDLTFRPQNTVTRAEACTMMYKFLENNR